MRGRARIAAVRLALLTAVLAVVVAVGGPAAAPGAEKPLRALDKRWVWVTSPRFEVLTNGPERRAREVIEELAAYRSTIGQMMGREVADPPTPIRIVLFDRVWDFAPYLPSDAAGRAETIAGYFGIRGDICYFGIVNESRRELPQTALSGYASVLIAQQVGELPLWTRAGLTHYLSAYHYLPRDRRAEIGRPIPDYVQYLNASAHFPLELVLKMKADSPEYSRDVPRFLFHAKSWLLVHYLQIGAPQRAGTLARFAKLRAEGVADLAALEQAAGVTLGELEDELAVYQKRSLMNLQVVELAEDPRGVAIETRPATREEVAYRLGEYLAAVAPERQRDAAAHFAAAGRPAPADPYAFQAPAAAAAPAPAATVSLDELRAAVAASPESVAALSALADAILRQEAGRSEPDATLLAEARRAIAAAARLDPGEVRFPLDLLRTYALDPGASDLAASLELLAEAAAAQPENSKLLEGYAALLIRDGQREAAYGVAQRALDALGVDGTSDELVRLLVEIDGERAVEWAKQGRVEEAKSLLTARIATTRQPAWRQELQESLASIRGVEEHNRARETYNRAVALTQARRYAEAATVLRQLVASQPPSPVAELAADSLAKLEAFLAGQR